MIDATDICRRRGGLNGVSVACPSGAITAILGPNGAGKSTLLDVLAGRSHPDSGNVRMAGRSIDSWPTLALAMHRAFLQQSADVAFPIRVWNLVALGRAPYGSLQDIEHNDQAIEESLRLTDTWVMRERVYQQLSGGERQRVQLARVLAQIWRPSERAAESRMLLLDEPTASLDPGHRLSVMRVLRQRADQGIGVVIALHDLNDALHFADHVILLRRGQLEAAGPPRQALNSQRLTAVYGTKAEIGKMPDGRSVIFFG
jgi:iron complex transport system ATP-binding protein